MSIGRIITGDADVAEGADWLAAHVPQFATALAATGPLPLRLRADGFDALIGAIISQQVSVASANAMRAKMDAAGLTHETAILTAGEDGLRAAGLSPALFILGFILGPMFEENFRRAMAVSHGDPFVFFQRPISLIFVLLGLSVLVLATTAFVRRGREEAEEA